MDFNHLVQIYVEYILISFPLFAYKLIGADSVNTYRFSLFLHSENKSLPDLMFLRIVENNEEEYPDS